VSPVVVIGGGAAGICAALWLREMEIPHQWCFELDAFGGTLLRVGNRVASYPGLIAEDGVDLVARFRDHAERVGVLPESSIHVTHVARADDAWRVHWADGSVATTQIVLCTGTRRRRLGVPGERVLEGRGVTSSITKTRHAYRGRAAVVVGGGDGALEGALLLADAGACVTLVHRGTSFRAQARFVKRAATHPKITIMLGARVTEIVGTKQVEGVALDDHSSIEADGVFVRIGVEPSIPDGFPADLCGVDGYVETTKGGRTKVAGVYAAGDVTTAEHQSVAAAIGDAARVVGSVACDRGSKSQALRVSDLM